MENGDQSSGSDPSAFLAEITGVPVTVKLNSGVVYKGKLASTALCIGNTVRLRRSTGELQSVDGYMNIALEKCQEFVNGQLRRTYGDAFVRGNNGEWFGRIAKFEREDSDTSTLELSLTQVCEIVLYISSG